MRQSLKRQISPNSLANLKPAKKGEVRNPHGGPKTPPDVKEALQAMLPQAVKRLGELLMSDNEKIVIKAVEVVLDRNLGKAVATKIDVKADMGLLHLEKLQEILARRREAAMVDVTPRVEGDTDKGQEYDPPNSNE